MKKIQAIIHYIFLSAVTVKAFNGTVEILSGLLFLFFGRQVEYEVYALTNFELTERHNDFVAKFLINSAHGLNISASHFVAYYLLFHGIMNFVLVIAIYRQKIWAYPAAVFLFSLFLIYQVIRVTHTHSVGLGAMSIIDLLMIVLTWLEYRRIITTEISENNL